MVFSVCELQPQQSSSRQCKSFKLDSSDKSNDASNFIVMSWNIEGLDRNSYNLEHFKNSYKPSLVFLSEPQVFSCDVARIMALFDDNYKYSLNSEGKHDLDIPMDRIRAKGGTMAMWCSDIDQYVTALPTSSAAVLPLMVKLPGLAPACHIGVYLPTAGLEVQFMALSELDNTIASVLEKFGEETIVFIRGDMNISSKNSSRSPLLLHIMSKHNLTRV
jgi:hypothetical protein